MGGRADLALSPRPARHPPPQPAPHRRSCHGTSWRRRGRGWPDRAVPAFRRTVAGKWASYNAPPDLPYDQREEDGGSLVFDTEVLTDPVEILGSSTVELDLSVNEPVAMVAARLPAVAPDGQATRVTYGRSPNR